MEEALTAILAPVAGGRRHWGRAPQATERPFVVLNRISGVRDYHMQGPSGYVASRVQMDVYADSFTSASDTAQAAIGILSGYKAGNILGIFIDSEQDLPAADAGEVNHLFRVRADLMVHHSQEN